MSVTCVRWHGHCSEFFKLIAGVRQGGVLSPFLFAIFVNDIVEKVQPVNMGSYVVSHFCTSIFLYADDILLFAPSFSGLQKLLSLCEEELRFLDMRINDKKSVCIRFGSRHDVCCAPITTHSRYCDTMVRSALH